MGFKLIFEPLKAKIPLSQIFKKMKNLTFGTKKKGDKNHDEYQYLSKRKKEAMLASNPS